MPYRPTIGLEVHAELKTRTKMFCACKNDPDEKRPNVNICPICLAHPGTLPVINKKAVEHILRLGAAVGGTIADFTEFDRKNYFYPDIPKGYQISQYQHPLVKGGELAGVQITRVHLEEDTARSSHENPKETLIDFNRAGVPLMELVTEPVIHDVETALRFAKELQLLLRTLGAGEANMEKGEMRVEANISISDSDQFGTKVEVKNLNSFRAVEKAILYELARHQKLLQSGGKVIQETRGWDDVKQETYAQRLKEDSHDYRYFPDPDLPKLQLSEIPEFSIEHLKQSLGELPWQKRARYQEHLGLKKEDADMLVSDPVLGPLFDAVVEELQDVGMLQLAANYITSDLAGLLKQGGGGALLISAPHFAELIRMLKEQELSSRAGKDILKTMFEQGGSPRTLAEQGGLLQQHDAGELQVIVEKIIADNPKVAADFKAGKDASLQFLIGQAMESTKGAGNPALLATLFRKLLA